jgi:hypothetical protein
MHPVPGGQHGFQPHLQLGQQLIQPHVRHQPARLFRLFGLSRRE